MVTPNVSGWPKKITVDRKIVNLLSRSLYTDFPRAIREAVSNSYDGDATVVAIRVDPKNKEVTIEDNGNGMSIEQFDKYLEIAGEKLVGGVSEKFKRKRIGRFGVGFLSCFPFCERLEITSKREGSDVGFTATIPTKRFVEGVGKEESVSSIPVDGYNEPYAGKAHEHYTRIRMLGLTAVAEDYFRPSPERRRISVETWEGMTKLKWQLCETLPLDYESQKSDLAKWSGNEPVGMEVRLNEERLYRSDPGGQIVASSEQTYIKLGNLEFKYAITTDWKIIHPVEARGLKIRIRNVGIGARTYLEIEKESRTFSRLNWLSGEVNVLSGLDESLALTRDSFIWSPEYQAIKDFFFTVLLRAHEQVESISTVEKEISQVFRANAVPSVLATEVIERSVKQLDSSGFDIIHRKKGDVKDSSYPLAIDKRNRIATVIDDYPKPDGITTGPMEPNLRVIRFEKAMSRTPVRMAEDGTIELNSAYPIFSGTGKGKMMKRVHLLLFQAKQECKSVDEMYDYLVRRLREEFG